MHYRFCTVLNRGDLPAAITALEAAGFIFRQAAGVTKFVDGPNAKARDAFHVIFAGEKIRDEYSEPVPSIDNYELIEDDRIMKLRIAIRLGCVANLRAPSA
jgi:hypothetical protein